MEYFLGNLMNPACLQLNIAFGKSAMVGLLCEQADYNLTVIHILTFIPVFVQKPGAEIYVPATRRRLFLSLPRKKNKNFYIYRDGRGINPRFTPKSGVFFV